MLDFGLVRLKEAIERKLHAVYSIFGRKNLLLYGTHERRLDNRLRKRKFEHCFKFFYIQGDLVVVERHGNS